MMGGLRSILEMGFAGIAFANFSKRAYQLLKKIIVFLLTTTKKFGLLVYNKFPLSKEVAALGQKMLLHSKDSQNGSTTVNLLMFGLRVASVLCTSLLIIGLCIYLSLKKNVERDIKAEYEDKIAKHE